MDRQTKTECPTLLAQAEVSIVSKDNDSIVVLIVLDDGHSYAVIVWRPSE